MSRRTTIWVPTSKLVPHPKNDNEMSEAMLNKLAANIQRTGKYPPIIVRSLEKSIEFTEQHDQGLYQIMDGEHRWKIACARCEEEVHVDVWEGIDDESAEIILATMNRLQGRSNPAKRLEIIRRLSQSNTVDALGELLPEDQDSIQKMIDSAKDAAGGDGDFSQGVSQNEPMTVWCQGEQKETIKAAIRRWLEENDPDLMIGECREGVALSSICAEYLGEA